MAVEITYPHIEKPADASARLQRVPRIRIAQIAMDYLAHGWPPEEICRQYPYLTMAEVHAALAYYFDNKDEVDAEIQREWEATGVAVRAAKPAFLARLSMKGRE